VILATHDTDLVPVLDELHDLHRSSPERIAKLETVSWFDAQARVKGGFAGGNIRATGGRAIWNTNLDRACYEASLDKKDYR